MARIRTYELDDNITANDYLLGNDGDNGSVITKRFALDDLAEYINTGIDVTEDTPARFVPVITNDGTGVERSQIRVIQVNGTSDVSFTNADFTMNILNNGLNGISLELTNYFEPFYLPSFVGKTFTATTATDTYIGTIDSLDKFENRTEDGVVNVIDTLNVTLTSGEVENFSESLTALSVLQVIGLQLEVSDLIADTLQVSGTSQFDEDVTIGVAPDNRSNLDIHGNVLINDMNSGIVFGAPEPQITLTTTGDDLQINSEGGAVLDVNVESSFERNISVTNGATMEFTSPDSDASITIGHDGITVVDENDQTLPPLEPVSANDTDGVEGGVLTDLRIGNEYFHIPVAQSAIASVLPGISEGLSPATNEPDDDWHADVDSIVDQTQDVINTITAGVTSPAEGEFQFTDAAASAVGIDIGTPINRFEITATYTTTGGDTRTDEAWDIILANAVTPSHPVVTGFAEDFPGNGGAIYTLAEQVSSITSVTVGGVARPPSEYTTDNNGAGGRTRIIFTSPPGTGVTVALVYDYFDRTLVDVNLNNDPLFDANAADNRSEPGDHRLDDIEGATITSFTYDTQTTAATGFAIVDFIDGQLPTGYISNGDILSINGAMGTASNVVDDGTNVVSFTFTYDTGIYGIVIAANPVTGELPMNVLVSREYIGATGDWWYGVDMGTFATFQQLISHEITTGAHIGVTITRLPELNITNGLTYHDVGIASTDTYVIPAAFNSSTNDITITGEDLDVIISTINDARTIPTGDRLFFHIQPAALPAVPNEPVQGHVYEIVGYLGNHTTNVGRFSFSRLGAGSLVISADNVQLSNIPDTMPGQTTLIFADNDGNLSKNTLEQIAGAQAVMNYEALDDANDNGSVTSIQFESSVECHNIRTGGGAIVVDVSGRFAVRNNGDETIPGPAHDILRVWNAYYLGYAQPTVHTEAERTLTLPSTDGLTAGDSIKFVNLSDLDNNGDTRATDSWRITVFDFGVGGTDRIMKLPANESELILNNTDNFKLVWSGNPDIGWIID